MNSEVFLRSAQLFAVDALGGGWSLRGPMPEGHEALRRALFAGMSLEYLVKAALCKRHPALIIDFGGNNNIDAWRAVAESVGHPAPP